MTTAPVPAPPPDAPAWSRGNKGRVKGAPRVPGSGRKPGVPNKSTAEIRRFILDEGKPHEFLVRIMRGEAVEDADGLVEMPTLDQRMQAAKWLFERVVPLAHQHEVGGIVGLAALLRDLPVFAGDDAED